MAFNELRKRGTAVKVSTTGDAKGMYAAAAHGADGSIAVMLANAGSKENPFTLDVARSRQSGSRCRVIDEKRTWVEISMPAALPPRAVLLVECDPQ